MLLSASQKGPLTCGLEGREVSTKLLCLYEMLAARE